MHLFSRAVAALLLVIAPATIGVISNAFADSRFPIGNWHGTNPLRGGGSGQWVSIVSMIVTPSPPRTVRDAPSFTVTLRLRIDGPGSPSLRRAPPPPIQYPRPDQRPGLVPDTRTIEITSSGHVVVDYPKVGQVMQGSVRPYALPNLPAATQCGFFLTVAEHGGPMGADIYYQIIPQRSHCSGGPFDGMAHSRGFLVR